MALFFLGRNICFSCDMGKDPVLAILIGDEAADAALKLIGSRGTSKKFPGCNELLVCCDRDEEHTSVRDGMFITPQL